MHYFTVLLVVGIAISSMAVEFENPEWKKMSEECAVEVGVDLTEFESIDKNDKDAWEKLFENHGFRCHSKCMSIKMGIMNEQGVVDLVKIKEHFKMLDESKLKVIGDCIEKTNQDDLCDKAYEIQKCIWSNIKHPE